MSNDQSDTDGQGSICSHCLCASVMNPRQRILRGLRLKRIRAIRLRSLRRGVFAFNGLFAVGGRLTQRRRGAEAQCGKGRSKVPCRSTEGNGGNGAGILSHGFRGKGQGEIDFAA